MTINEFLQEWPYLTLERKKEGLKTLFDLYLQDIMGFESELLDFLGHSLYLEDDDAFGTEGANI